MIIKINSEKLGNIIEITLKGYRLPDIYYNSSQDINYPLYEKLCIKDESVNKGFDRIHDIVDAIICDIILYRNKERDKPSNDS